MAGPRLVRHAVVLALALALSSCVATAPALGAGHGRNGRAARRHSCPNAGLRPTATNLALIRGATLCLVNRERTIRGEAPLRPNRRLRHAAQGHTASMARGNYFKHSGSAGQSPAARIRASGYISSRTAFEVGENIAWGTLWLATPRAIVASWMHSAGHRANILDPRYRDTGIGVSPHAPTALAHGQAGAVYTQDFGVIIHG